MVYGNLSSLFSDKDENLVIETACGMTYSNCEADNDDFFKADNGDIIHISELEQYLTEDEEIDISQFRSPEDAASELGYRPIHYYDWKEAEQPTLY